VVVVAAQRGDASPPTPEQSETDDVKTDLARTAPWPVGRAGLPFQCVIPDQFRVLLLVQAVQVFRVRKHFRHSSGSVNLLFMKGDAANPG
jgi:hypothetical protein